MYAQAIVAFGLATLASAHMKMSSPAPYGATSLNNSPLDANGADFPCKQRTGVYDAEGASNVYAQGAGGKLAFIGSAVHGGGSCQVSITYDAKPDKNSVWKVIKSIEGGCPAKNAAGNLGDNANQANQDTYDFTIPDDMPAGNGTIAWTWFNKIGNREMYMNCGPVTITGSAGSQTAYEALPDMFTANIFGSGGCSTKDSADVAFPNAGTSVDKFGTGELAAPINCGSSGGGGSTGSPAPSSTAGAGNGGAQPTTAPTSAPAVSQPAASSKPSASIPGGVFITVPNGSGSTPTASATPSASKAPAASAAPSATPSTGSGSGSGSGSGNGTETGAGAQTVGAACTDEGAWNCIGGTSYQRCASGAWSAVQQLASGTSCTAGMGSSINMVVTRNGRKRALRFRSHA